MKNWIKNIGTIFIGLSLFLFFTGSFNLEVESERSAFYIMIFLAVTGWSIYIYSWYEKWKLKKSKDQ